MGTTIRAASISDAASVAAIYAPLVRDTAVSFELEPPDAEEMAARIARWSASHAWLVCETEGRVVGYAYGSPFHERPAYRWSSDVTVYVAPEARAVGVGAGLVTRLMDALRDRGYVNAFAGVALPNDASVRLFESLGFEQVGTFPKVGFKLGGWHDVGWWHRALVPHPVGPPRMGS